MVSFLYYEQFVSDIKIGNIVNPYNPCVANKVINNKQHSIIEHIDDVKSTHLHPKVNYNFAIW